MKITSVRGALILSVGALVSLAGAVACGIGHSPRWLPAGHSPPLPGAHIAAVELPEISLVSLDSAWRKPLFSPNRRPGQAAQSPMPELSGLVLTGVVADGNLQLALLRDASSHTLRIHQGQTLPNGWTLQQLSPLEAQFTYQGQTRSLRIPMPRLPSPSRAAMLTLPPVTEP